MPAVGLATAELAITVQIATERLRASTETATTALLAQTDLLILITRVTAAQATPALTAVTAVTAITEQGMLQPQPAITEAARTALPAPISQATLLIQATAGRAMPAHGLAMRLITRAAAPASPEILTATKAPPKFRLV